MPGKNLFVVKLSRSRLLFLQASSFRQSGIVATVQQSKQATKQIEKEAKNVRCHSELV
jgi:hypothetical protein